MHLRLNSQITKQKKLFELFLFRMLIKPLMQTKHQKSTVSERVILKNKIVRNMFNTTRDESFQRTKERRV
jgi:hypothetical protein